MTTNKNFSFGLQGLHLQTIENDASRPGKTSFVFDPCKRFCKENKRLNDPLLKPFGRFFEWAYGYKNTRQTNKLNKRRTPSAGALYPTELFLLSNLNGEWKLCYYSFEEHAFFLCPISNNSSFSLEMLDPDISRVFMVSALWRTVQRYGVRGFRYCLLDAGFISRNIERILNDQQLFLHLGNHKLHDFLPLMKGEKVLYSISLSNAFIIEEEPDLNNQVNLCNYVYTGSTPCISTNMIRVEDAVSKAFQYQKQTFALPFFNLMDLNREDMLSCIEHRFSVKEFLAEPLSDNSLVQLQQVFRKCAAHIYQCYKIPVHAACIINHTSSKQDEVEILYYKDLTERNFSSVNIAGQVWGACQNQAIMLNASFSFVFFVIPEEISNWSHFKYVTSVLSSSFICSDLYISSLKFGIGTTTIGGFSEKSIMEILQLNDILPIVVQAFGKTKVGHTKVDSVQYLQK